MKRQISISEGFLKSLRSERTRDTYGRAFDRVFTNGMNADAFIELARRDKNAAELYLLNWLDQVKKEGLRGCSIRTYLASIKSLHDFADISPTLNWKKIGKACPRASRSQDRPVSMEEIRMIFSPADLRFKFIVSLMDSSGMRVGAFDYLTLKDLQPFIIEDFSEGHFNPKKMEIGKLRVYAGENEQYTTFVSSECMELFQAYREERRRSGEVLNPDSPLVRQPVSFRKERKEREAVKTSSKNVTAEVRYAWRKAGLQEREFKANHGFRKHFKTALESAGMKSITVEALMGHLSQLDSSYYRPTTEQLAQEYAKYQTVLFIDPSLSLKEEKEKLYAEASTKISSQSSRMELLETKVKELTAALDRYEANLKAIQEERERENLSKISG